MRELAVIAGSLALALVGCAGTSTLSTSWEYTGGPYAQDLSSFLAVSAPQARLLVGTITGDVFESADGGQSWSRISTVQAGAHLFQILEDPDSAGRLYAATAAGAFYSPNGGKEWTRMPVGTPGPEYPPCRALAVDPWKSTVLYAGTVGHGIYRSTDGGRAWSPVPAGQDSGMASAEIYDIKVDISQPDVVYAALSPLGLMRSTDGGASWERLTPEIAGGGAKVTHVLVNPKARNEILYGTDTGNIFRSTDGGLSWSKSKQGDAYDRIHSLVSHPTLKAVVIVSTDYGCAVSSDFGGSWESVSGALSGVPLSVAAGAPPADSLLFGFGDGVGLQVSPDGGKTWSAADKDLGGAHIRMIRTDRSGRTVLAATGQTVFRYDPERATWLPSSRGIRGSSLNTFAMDNDSASILYAATPAGVFTTSDAGQSWRLSLRKLSIIPTFIDSHPSIRTRMFASSDRGIFVSTDKGNSWGQARPFRSGFSIRSFTYMPTNAGIILGATTEGVIASSDGGFTWERPRLGPGTPDVIAVTLSTEKARTYFAWTSKGECFRSTNGGLEWSAFAPPWSQGPKVDIAVDRHTPSSVIAIVAGRQVYYSATAGATWHRVGEKSPPLDITALHWNAETSTLFIGTRNTGVFRISLEEFLRDLPTQQTQSP